MVLRKEETVMPYIAGDRKELDVLIDRLAEAISRFKAIEQIIAVTHSEAFAEKAEHVITLEKEAGISKVSIGR